MPDAADLARQAILYMRTTRHGESGFALRLARLCRARAGVRILIED